MKVYPLAVGPLGTNCYIVADGQGTVAVIDPGDEGARIQATLDRLGLTLGAVLLTHVHFDHIGAADELASETVPLYCHEDETAARRNLSGVFGDAMTVQTVPHTVREGDTVTVGELSFEVWHTPGHTPGSVCYVTPTAMFSGDTLFCESIGLTDFPGGSPAEMARSLRRLLSEPADRKVYPGHDEPTTLSHERQYNPYAGI